MIKQIQLLYRKPSISGREFDEHWMKIHAPLYVARMMPEQKKYVQNHLVREPGTEPMGDGIVEHWYASLDDLKKARDKSRALRDSPDRKALSEDTPKFLDMSRTVTWIVEEFVIKERTDPPKGNGNIFKQVQLLYRQPHISIEEFDEHWLKIHGPLYVAMMPPEQRKYVQNHLVREPGTDYMGDGIVEHCYDSLEILKSTREKSRTSNSPERQALLADIPNLHTSGSLHWLVEEHIIK